MSSSRSHETAGEDGWPAAGSAVGRRRRHCPDSDQDRLGRDVMDAMNIYDAFLPRRSYGSWNNGRAPRRTKHHNQSWTRQSRLAVPVFLNGPR